MLYSYSKMQVKRAFRRPRLVNLYIDDISRGLRCCNMSYLWSGDYDDDDYDDEDDDS